jgi:hypothetical protein
MHEIIEDSDEDQFANGQSSRDLRVGSDAGEVETQLMKRSKLPATSFRLLDRSNKSEISSRGITRAAVIKPRRADPHPGLDRTKSGCCAGAEASR